MSPSASFDEQSGRYSAEIEQPLATEHNRLVIRPENNPTGQPGDYQVVFVLGVPGTGSVLWNIDVDDLTANGGDSLIAIAGKRVEITQPGGRVWSIYSNAIGHLSRAEVILHADVMAQAEHEAYDQVTPIISRFAFEANAGIEIQAMVTTELASGAKCVAAVLGGQVKVMQDMNFKLNAELGYFFAAYRDGLTSLNPIYAALSFYRAIEGVATFHKRKRRIARKNGGALPPDPLSEAFPPPTSALPEIYALAPSDYPGLSGKSIREVWEELKVALRNGLAHITPGGSFAIADRQADLEACRSAIPVLRYIARRALEAEMLWADSQE